MLQPGSRAPSFSLADIDGHGEVADPWADPAADGVVVAFFKVTCPVCRMAAPKVGALADAGVRVVAVGEDPPDALHSYRGASGQRVRTLSEPPPYSVSTAYDIQTVPALYLIDPEGTIVDAVEGWERAGWNRLAATAGMRGPVSTEGDGLPALRPG